MRRWLKRERNDSSARGKGSPGHVTFVRLGALENWREIVKLVEPMVVHLQICNHCILQSWHHYHKRWSVHSARPQCARVILGQTRRTRRKAIKITGETVDIDQRGATDELKSQKKRALGLSERGGGSYQQRHSLTDGFGLGSNALSRVTDSARPNPKDMAENGTLEGSEQCATKERDAGAK